MPAFPRGLCISSAAAPIATAVAAHTAMDAAAAAFAMTRQPALLVAGRQLLVLLLLPWLRCEALQGVHERKAVPPFGMQAVRAASSNICLYMPDIPAGRIRAHLVMMHREFIMEWMACEALQPQSCWARHSLCHSICTCGQHANQPVPFIAIKPAAHLGFSLCQS